LVISFRFYIYRYAFWYRYDSGKGSTNYTNYNQSIKKIASFQSVERFWTIYDYLKRPSDFKDIKAVEFHLFKDGISPFWEDSQNKAGGKWMLRLRKGVAARYWEDILLAIIGEQFDVGAEICGAVLSIRGNEDIISVWNKTAENTEAVNKIR
jgi:translation initiation factor 4E